MSNPNSYFESIYEPPWKGVNSSLPKNKIDGHYTPFATNWIPRSGDLRTRPRLSQFIPGLPDNSVPLGINSFADSNNVVHTIVISTTALYQLNSNWRHFPGQEWSLIQRFGIANAGNFSPAATQIFLNQLYFTLGDFNLWNWNGLTPNSLSAGPALQSIAQYDTVNHLLAGAFFLGELDSRLILLNTFEQQNTTGKPSSNFAQRIRWSASGLPTVWDPTVNTGAGFNDELDVPDSITGFLTIGRNGFVFRTNGITEMISISSGLLPFDFNHLWASDRGIGNVYAYSIAGYGPIGAFISTDDIYQLSLGGFKKIGSTARDAIFIDIGNAIGSPIASMFPNFSIPYPYMVYKIAIPMPGFVTKNWCYFVEDEAWFPWTESTGLETTKCKVVPTL